MQGRHSVLKLFYGLAATLAMGNLALAMTGPETGSLLATPFIAADSSQTKDFSAVATSTGKSTPYFLQTKGTERGVYCGKYCGVILDNNGQPGFPAFDTLTYSHSGSRDTRTIVSFKPPFGPFRSTMLTQDKALRQESGKDGFTRVSFSRDQFQIPPGSFIREIVIVPPSTSAGRVRVDDVRVDQSSVKKAMATKFFDATKTGGPAGFLNFTGQAVASTYTQIQVKNKYTTPVVCWVSNVNAPTYFPTVTWFQVGANYWTLMQPGASFTSQFDATNLGVNGRVYFGIYDPRVQACTSNSFGICPQDPTALTNPCPRPKSSQPWNYCGITLFEFFLNPPATNQNESTNVSLNDGMNSLIQANYSNNGGNAWVAGAFQLTNVKNVMPLSANANIPGIYPYNCPCCFTPGAGCNNPNVNCGRIYPCTQACTFPTNPPTVGSTNNACQGSRAAGVMGGTIIVTFLKWASDGSPTTPDKFCF